MELNKIYTGDAIKILQTFPDKSVDCCVTSPPYFGLRDYGTATWEGMETNCNHRRNTKNANPDWRIQSRGKVDNGVGDEIFRDVCYKCGATRIDHQIGLEKTPELYVAKMVEVFTEVKRVLKNEGTLWLNLGDSYAARSMTGGNNGFNQQGGDEGFKIKRQFVKPKNHSSCKPKDLIGIPWLTAFALRSSGWYLRQDIIWCLSGGAYLYVKSQKGVMPMMVKDMVRLNPATIQLWNGEKWTQVLGSSNKSVEKGQNIEIVLRSGERIGCTSNHQWPTGNGLKKASELAVGDIIQTCHLPEQDSAIPQYLTEDALWFIGLYLAEGSISGNGALQIAGHIKESARLERVKKFALHYGSIATHTIDGNNLNIRIHGKIIRAIIKQFVSGNTAYDKGLSTAVWNLPNSAIRLITDGYLSGDGHYDIDNNRWRLGFCRNYNLERDLRTLAARLGATLTLKPGISSNQTGKFPSFKGEWRWERSTHFNNMDRGEIIEIRNSRGRKFWDIGVADEPHLFSLASGVLTHNSKPNPMPESVTDRCTKSHEYIFLMSKSAKYYYDADAIKTKLKGEAYHMIPKTWAVGPGSHSAIDHATIEGQERKKNNLKGYQHRGEGDKKLSNHSGNYAENGELIDGGMANKRSIWTVTSRPYSEAHFATFPERLITDCIKAGCPENGIVLDPFMGAGTTGLVARKLNRNFIGIELNPAYIKLAEKRLKKELGMFH